MLAPIITNNLQQIKDICQKHYVKELYVFGSAAKNEMKADSDVDFSYVMKEVPNEKTANNFFDMLSTFEELFKTRVDLVPMNGLRNRIFIEELNNAKQLLYKS